MSWDINQVVLIGRLTKDPEMRYGQSGTAVSVYGLAVSRKSYGVKESSEVTDEVDYFNIVAFGKTAELCSQYLFKGKQVCISGSLRQQRWEDSNGQKRNKVEILVNKIQFLGSISNNNNKSNDNLKQDKEFNQSYSSENIKNETNNLDNDNIKSELEEEDDAIPF